MGNPTLHPDCFRTIGVSPPYAPPRQPGEERSCSNCVRFLGLIENGRSANCAWQGRWDWPKAGCTRWGGVTTPAAQP